MINYNVQIKLSLITFRYLGRKEFEYFDMVFFLHDFYHLKIVLFCI